MLSLFHFSPPVFCSPPSFSPNRYEASALKPAPLSLGVAAAPRVVPCGVQGDNGGAALHTSSFRNNDRMVLTGGWTAFFTAMQELASSVFETAADLEGSSDCT